MRNSHSRLLPFTLQGVLLVALCVLASDQTLAQAKPSGADKSPLCTHNNSLSMIKQQLGLTKTFNDSKQRITVLIRVADLLWPHEQKRARAVFAEAFDVAVEYQKENGERGSNSILSRMMVADQRHVVVRAVARRDQVWAKELVEQLAKTDREAAPGSGSLRDVLTAARLLDSANQLMSLDLNAALELAGTSLNYPASFMLNHFLFRLAGVNQQLADQFYARALTAYGDKPMREFLYLQAYPFAWRETVNTPVFSFHENIPANFVPNQSLQRQFIQVLLRRAQLVLEAPLDPSDTYQNQSGVRMPGRIHLLQGLIKLEPQVRTSLPDLSGPLTQAREKILVTLSVDLQQTLVEPGREASTKPARTFDEEIELAQKVADLNERDELITSAVLGSGKESFADVVRAIEKISDSTLRAHAFEWFYFQRAAAAVNDKRFEEAERLTSKVEGLEERAYLHLEIAKALFKSNDAQTHAQEVLDEAIVEARKAGPSIFAARSLLTAANVYTKLDLSRSIAIMADAINVINRVDAPDFVSDDQAIEKEVERKGRDGHYRGEYVFRFYMPGLDPERAFRETAKLHFDTALSQSNALTDKFQRALATLALSDVCLQQQPAKEKPKKIGKP